MKKSLIKLTFLIAILFSISIIVPANHSITTDKDEWISVRSKNFFLIGDAKEKDIRAVATKLEQFRTAFSSIFPNAKFNQTIETNVVVFKDRKSYKPFLPKGQDGKADEWIGGYFQPGEDVNYISMSLGGNNKDDNYGIIFHEYTHFLLNTNYGRSEIPPWFNEGLAEYYQTFEIEDDQNVYLGKLQNNHLYLLQQKDLIPLKDFFAIDNYSLHQNGNHSRNIFYAQAWALMHYLIQSNQIGNLSKFLGEVTNNIEPEKAFQDAFGMNYEAMENILKKYAKQTKFNITVAKFKNKLLFDNDMSVLPLSDSEANAYLGDLLYHTHEYDDAEVYLQKSLTLDENQSLANTTLGLVRMRQGKLNEAKKYLEKAVASNRKNHYAHYNYAYVLSRESLDEFGQVTGYPTETAKIMRKSLIEAININPNFTESYRLLAFINLVNNEELDQAVEYLQKALSLLPGNEEYSLTIAQIYLRQEKFDEAEKIAKKIAKSAIESGNRSEAESILSNVKSFRANAEYRGKIKKQDDPFSRANVKMKSTLTEEEIKEIQIENQSISLNGLLEPPKEGEKRIVGYTQKVECLRGGIKYTIKTDDGTVLLKSKDFLGIEFLSLTADANDALINCGADMREFKVVYTYRDGTDAAFKTSGNLVGMAYVPKIFRLKTAEELKTAKHIIIVDEAEQKIQQLESIKISLHKPEAGEKQILGIMGKIECHKEFMFFRIKFDGKEMRLKTNSPQKVLIRIYTPEAEMVNFRCGVTPPAAKVIVTYRPTEKDASNSQGDAVAIEFVPKSFELK